MMDRRSLSRGSRRWRLAPAACAAVACVLAAAAPAPAQVDVADREALRAAIEARYEVVPLRQGTGLVPHEPVEGVRLIEIVEGTVALNGVVATAGELRARLGADADLIVRLTYLDDGERQALFSVDEPRPAPDAPPAAAPPPAPPRPRRVSQGGEIVRFGGSVLVEAHEQRRGDVVVIGGSARIEGEVLGDVVVVLGSAAFGPEARVRGSVTVVGGGIRRARGAEISGDISEIGLGRWPIRIDSVHAPWPAPISPFPRFGNVFGTIFRLILFGLLASIVVLLARGPVEGMGERAAAEPWKAVLVGLLAQVLFVPLLVLTVVVLAVSVIGIPLLLLVPFALVVLFFVVLAGFAGVAEQVGQWVAARAGGQVRVPYAALWAGIALLMAPTLLGHVVGAAGGFFAGLGVVLVATGLMLEYGAWTAGLGAAVMGWFASRRPVQPAPPAAA